MEDYELLEWSECELRGYLCGGISVITPLPAGEGTGEGPAVVGWLRAYHLVCYIVFIRCLGGIYRPVHYIYTMGKAAAR